jgi:hypothetical protein
MEILFAYIFVGFKWPNVSARSSRIGRRAGDYCIIRFQE